MPRPTEDILNEVGSFTGANPGLFNGVAPGNVIAHLGTVNPNLWNQLNEAYKAQGSSGFASAITNGAKAGLIGGPMGASIGALYGGGKSLLAAGAPTLNEFALANPGLGQSLVGQPVAPTAPTPAPVAAPSLPSIGTPTISPEVQKMLDDLYGKVETSGLNKIGDAAGQQRTNAANDAAALGNLNSTGTLNDVDRAKTAAVGNFEGDLAGKKVSSIEDFLKLDQATKQQDIANKQFLMNYGLNEKAADEKIREYNLSRQDELYANEQALALGRAQANANQPSTLDQIISGVTGAGSLAGGLGGLFGGLGKLQAAGQVAQGAGAASGTGSAPQAQGGSPSFLNFGQLGFGAQKFPAPTSNPMTAGLNSQTYADMFKF